MLVSWYLTRRFLGYFTTLVLFLAFLFNLVEFFEKIVRVKHVAVGTVFHFLGLNILPSLFELMPVGLWLATCFLLKELATRHEFECLHLLTFIPRRFFSFFLLMGLGVALVTFGLREQFVAHLTIKAERFKKEAFKLHSDQKIISKWVELDEDRFCYFSVLDAQKSEGTDLLIVTMSPQFRFQQIITAPYFTIDPKVSSVIIPEARIEQEGEEGRTVNNIVVNSPGFFSHLRMNFDVPTVGALTKKILLYRHVLPRGVYYELWYELLARIIFYIQLLLYPLMTACLFMFTRHQYMRWLLMLLPYPLLTGMGAVTDTLFRCGWHPIVSMFPYVFIMFFIVWSVRRWNR